MSHTGKKTCCRTIHQHCDSPSNQKLRHRHLMNDLYSLLPHSRKESKLDTKTKLYQLNELAELYNCNNVLFFEARKGKDLYLWMSKPPNGPTVKFHLQNRRPLSIHNIYCSGVANVKCSSASSHDGRTAFHWQLPQRLPTDPLFRCLLRKATSLTSY